MMLTDVSRRRPFGLVPVSADIFDVRVSSIVEFSVVDSSFEVRFF